MHPDWVYCEYNYAGDQHEFENPEETMKHFFHKMQKPRWNWGTTRVVPLPQCSKGAYQRGCEICKHLRIFFIILVAIFQSNPFHGNIVSNLICPTINFTNLFIMIYCNEKLFEYLLIKYYPNISYSTSLYSTCSTRSESNG